MTPVAPSPIQAQVQYQEKMGDEDFVLFLLSTPTASLTACETGQVLPENGH